MHMSCLSHGRSQLQPAQSVQQELIALTSSSYAESAAVVVLMLLRWGHRCLCIRRSHVVWHPILQLTCFE